MPIISIIIPCFNAEIWIRETLSSVISQQVEGTEIIVIDDGSTDESARIIEDEFPFVYLIRTKNQGPSKTRNLGTNISKAEFIQYLDADDILAPGKLRLQLEALKMSGADVAYGDWQNLVRVGNKGYVKGEIIKRKMQNPEIDLFTDFWCPLAAYLFRRSIVEKVGGFKETLPIIQDARFSIDCALSGARFVYCEGVMAYYREPTKASVSRKDPVGFVRDCFHNAIEVEKWWQDHGGINKERKKALLEVYGFVARASFERDPDTFKIAYKELERLSPGYIPEKPKDLRLVSYLLGYQRAEVFALWYRRLKNFLFSLLKSGTNKN